jgi:hypothetical protein
VFPYTGNENLKKSLDKLRKLVQEQKIGAGPWRFTEKVEGLTEPVKEFENLSRTIQNYQDIKREAE